MSDFNYRVEKFYFYYFGGQNVCFLFTFFQSHVNDIAVHEWCHSVEVNWEQKICNPRTPRLHLFSNFKFLLFCFFSPMKEYHFIKTLIVCRELGTPGIGSGLLHPHLTTLNRCSGASWPLGGGGGLERKIRKKREKVRFLVWAQVVQSSIMTTPGQCSQCKQAVYFISSATTN